MRSSRLFFTALGSALSALLVSPVAAADEPVMDPEVALDSEDTEDADGEDIEEVEDIQDLDIVSAGTLRSDTERTPAVVLGLKTMRPGRDPEMIGVFLFSRRPTPAPRERRSAAPLRIAPARLNGVWVLIAEGRF